jgi:cell division protein FtsL
MKNKKQPNTADAQPSLLKALVVDLFVRHWIVSALVVLFVVSSMQLASTSHKSRKLTAEWQALRQAQQAHQVAWESLRLELTALSEADRISNLAKKQLGMVDVTTKNEMVISL